MMWKCWYYSSYTILLYFITNRLDAQHHSVYIPNYLQAFDYPNADETPSSVQQQDHLDYRFSEGLDTFQADLSQTTAGAPPQPLSTEFSTEASTIHTEVTTSIAMTNTTPSSTNTTGASLSTSTITLADATITNETNSTTSSSSTSDVTFITSEQTTLNQTSTEPSIFIDPIPPSNDTFSEDGAPMFSSLNDTLWSTSTTHAIDVESNSTDEQVSETTAIYYNDTSTMETLSKNDSDFIINFLNRTRLQSKNLINDKSFDIYNTTAEEAARHFTDRKTMQSLIHLLPPNLWSQFQNNFSMPIFNQSQYAKPSLPDPAVLAEVAAQAGLSVPGQYPMPEYGWQHPPNIYRNPPPILNNMPRAKPTPMIPRMQATMKPIRPPQPNVFFKLPNVQAVYPTKPAVRPRESSTYRAIYKPSELRPASYVPMQALPPPPSVALDHPNIHSLLSQIGFTCPSGVNGIRFPDQRLCNMYFTCTQSGLPEPSLCPEGYLFSEISRDCELASRVNCGARLSAFFDVDNPNINNPSMNNGVKLFTTGFSIATSLPPTIATTLTTTPSTSTTTTTTTATTTTTTSTTTTTTTTSTTTTTTTTTTTSTTTTTTSTSTSTTTTTTTTTTSTTTTSTRTTRTTSTTAATTRPIRTTTSTTAATPPTVAKIITTTPAAAAVVVAATRKTALFFPYNRLRPTIINGTLECVLGADGYFEDSLYCNVYHHCLAGIDYIEHCPNQLAWNEMKKMCDWTTNVNCTGKTMTVVQGKTSFCTNRQDGRYASETYCNAFHHCIGGTDHIVRCTGELQWDDAKKECGWESYIQCGAPKKMLPNENKFNSTFCTGKTDGSYPHDEFCNVYHVCESGADNMRQCPHQLFWDHEQQKCEWSNNVRCTGRTLVALSVESSLFCMEKSDGIYIDPIYCNVYHQCMGDIDVKLRCPERLIFNETLKACDWPESSICKGGNILLEGEGKDGFCTDKPNGNFAHEQYCNRYYICQNGKDVVFTCQNNLRYSVDKNECDWAVNVDCKGKPDYMWEGIKENFCKRLPDGNYPDVRFCNIFHQCQAAMDYPKRCPNRLMFNEETKECDWEDKVDCKGREKLIDTEGLDEEVRPGTNNTRGRSTKFCMVKQNGDYADSYYCNVYHNCHGGFDTIQYCTRGLVWRQETETIGQCDWSKERSSDGADCHGKAVFFVEKLAERDILSNLRSEFCISKGAGLYEHQRYCDLYLQCNEQGVGVTMECSPGLVFNERKKECDYQGDVDDETKGTLCLTPRSFLRSKPKAEQASILFEGADATGQFPTRFDCINKDQQNMFADLDWCNIYHVCIGNRDNIFLCPPGTIFNDEKQGCMDRLDGTNCNGTRSYYKPTIKRQKRIDPPMQPPPSAAAAAQGMTRKFPPSNFRFTDLTQSPSDDNHQRIPYEWRKSQRSREHNDHSFDRRRYH